MIVELEPFDLLTTSPTLLLASGGLWSSLPRISRGEGLARLLFVADTLEKDQVLRDFQAVATDERYLPPGVMAYRLEYEAYLERMVQAVSYIRAYLVIEPHLDEDGLAGLLGAYGLRMRPLTQEVPRPFNVGRSQWEYLETDRGYVGMLRSAAQQNQALLHPRLMHPLFAQDFPVYAALQIYTYPQAETMRLLNQKAALAQYSGAKTVDGIQEAEQAKSGVQMISEALGRGEALHAVRLWVLVSGENRRQLNERLEIVRGSLGLKMERVYAPGEVVRKVFSAELRVDNLDGTPLTTTGAALLAGSALSYRRRTETRGVMLGVDRNQAPVILDLFAERHASYNTVILGQTGSGKTFATLMLMLRHLMLGTRLIILDPQGNIDLSFLGEEVYQHRVLGGHAAKVNVLDVVHEEIGQQVELAIAMLRLLGVHGDRPVERALLDEALMGLYQPIWGKGASPLMGDLYRRMSVRVGMAQSAAVRDAAESLTLALQAYVTGSRAEMFGQHTSMDFNLDHAVNVFDVSRLPQQGLGGNLRSALLSILVANINQGIRRRRQAGDRAPILFFVDEMGILMRDAVVANYISAEYKTARARLVGMIVADQDLHSLLGPQDEKGLHHGVPILANAANTLLFNQKDSERARIQEHFPMLPQEVVDMLPALPRGTCVGQFADGDLLVVSVVPSRLDQVVLSSRLQDRDLARQIVAQLKKEIEA